MPDRIGKRIIHCDDCVLAFAIPTSHASFIECKHNPENRDFVPYRCGAWQKYEHEFIRLFEMIAPTVRSWGGALIHELTLEKFTGLFQRFPIIILFAHYKDKDDHVPISLVEFYDGLVPIPDVVDCIPFSFAGVLDLCVCHPEGLAELIRDERPNCLTRWSDEKAKPRYWLYFYLHLFSVLREGSHTYLAAYEMAYRKMLELEKMN